MAAAHREPLHFFEGRPTVRKIRVLVIDDSPTMCAILGEVLRQDAAIEIVGTAGDPYEAREAIKALSPDVITLDVNMPRMDGLEFLEKLMRLRPMPVVMISSLTSRNADLSMQALELGAFDCVGKPTGEDFMVAMRNLPEIVKAAARAPVGTARHEAPAPAPAPTATRMHFNPGRMIVIGASTGGVDALQKVLSGFPANCPPTLITQHMPDAFITSFTQRLDTKCAPRIVKAEDGMPIQPNTVYIAPGDAHLRIGKQKALTCQLDASAPVSGHMPSVDVLFDSAVIHGNRVVAAILTGMGSDGAAGMAALRAAGARTFGQDEKSSVVFGMARAAQNLNAIERFVSLHRIGGALLDACAARQKAA